VGAKFAFLCALQRLLETASFTAKKRTILIQISFFAIRALLASRELKCCHSFSKLSNWWLFCKQILISLKEETAPRPDRIILGTSEREENKKFIIFLRNHHLVFEFIREMKHHLLFGNCRKVNVFTEHEESGFDNFEFVVSIDLKPTVVKKVVAIQTSTDVVTNTVDRSSNFKKFGSLGKRYRF
jgi:hypothetical protein